MTSSNTESNTKPDPELLERMRREHHIGWHPKGGWCRKFPGERNRTYFGRVEANEAIRQNHLEEHRRTRSVHLEEEEEQSLTRLTLKQAADIFLGHLDKKLTKNKISIPHRARYGDALHFLASGPKNAEDWHIHKSDKLSEFCKLTAPERIFSPLREALMAEGIFSAEKRIIQIRTFLEWCSTTRRYMPTPFYADAFDPPGIKEKRELVKSIRRQKGNPSWEPREVREIVDAAKGNVHRYAQILLMINGGMGATDLSNLEDDDIDWPRECIHTDRSKTLVPRVVPLWDITQEAMKASRAQRPRPAKPEWDSRFFLTKHGQPLVMEYLGEKRRSFTRSDSLKNWFYQLVNSEKRREGTIRLPHLKRHRGGVYTLRSVFTTMSIGHGQDENLEAIILGQKFSRDILEYYIKGEHRDKLVQIVNHVRRQIWP